MSFKISSNATVLVVGAGIMGAGIAQVATQAGHPVCLFDLREGAAAEAICQLGATLDKRVSKGKLAPEAVRDTLARLRPVGALADAKDAAPVVEAIAENLDAKRALFGQLEAIVGERCVLVTNTSSISGGPVAVAPVLDGLEAHYRGERYRVSPWLRQHAGGFA